MNAITEYYNDVNTSMAELNQIEAQIENLTASRNCDESLYQEMQAARLAAVRKVYCASARLTSVSLTEIDVQTNVCGVKDKNSVAFEMMACAYVHGTNVIASARVEARKAAKREELAAAYSAPEAVQQTIATREYVVEETAAQKADALLNTKSYYSETMGKSYKGVKYALRELRKASQQRFEHLTDVRNAIKKGWREYLGEPISRVELAALKDYKDIQKEIEDAEHAVNVCKMVCPETAK